MSRYPEFDLTKIHTQPFAERLSKVSVEDFAAAPVAGTSFADFLSGLPNILAGREIVRIATSIVEARRQGRAVIASLGGHVVKTGLSPVINALVNSDFITGIAVNGALAIHDCEIALFGTTSEDVVSGLKSGSFGMAKETAEFYNSAIVTGASQGLGAGESLGKALSEAGAPFSQYSILAECYKLEIPITVHIALGTDIVHCHPNANGAALGEATLRDFRILTHIMQNLTHGGVLLNLGSAVVLPEVLLKAIAILRNQYHNEFTDFLGVNFDFIQQYRSNQQVVTRVNSIGGQGVALTGHHEIMIPLLGQAIFDVVNNNIKANIG